MEKVEIWDIEVGYVTARRGARLHLIVDGHSACHSGTRIPIRTRRAFADDAPKICKHCIKHFKQTIVQILGVRRMRRPEVGNTAIIRAAEALHDGLLSDRDRLELEAMRSGIRDLMAMA